jgi:type IV pilus assembly protein PilE
MSHLKKTSGGVTLVELLITIVVVGILASVAIPSYRNHILRANRAEAKTALLSIAGGLERCFTRNNTYVNADTTPCTATASLPFLVASGNYKIDKDGDGITANKFYLKAVPQAGQVKDVQCGTLTLDYANSRGVTGGTQSAQSCWGR